LHEKIFCASRGIYRTNAYIETVSHIEGVSPGKLLTVWAINRVSDHESATQLERWVPVPTTDLPYLAGIPAEEFTKDAFLSALDFVDARVSRKFVIDLSIG
jgi:hypothetical protein